MVYLRGHPNDFDRSAESGCTGRGYEDLLPYFRRMETVCGADARYRGTDGLMRPARVSKADANPLSQVFLDGAGAAGFPLTDDLNGAFPEGAGWHDLSIADAAGRARPTRICTRWVAGGPI